MKNLSTVLILLASFSTISAQKSEFGQQNIQTKSEKLQTRKFYPILSIRNMSRNHLEFKKKYNVEVMYEKLCNHKIYVGKGKGKQQAGCQNSHRKVRRFLETRSGIYSSRIIILFSFNLVPQLSFI